MAIIRPDQYVELYSELAELMMTYLNANALTPEELLIYQEENGDIRYTELGQQQFEECVDDVEAVLTANNIIKVSDVEYNVLQVAIDHMIEHQEGIQSDDVPCDDAEWDDICERLEAAKKLKALFS
jgi:hypothetical protein